MIVRVEFSNHDTIMFGNSYKTWDDQYSEFIRCGYYGEGLTDAKVIKVETSKDKWIGWGGLKWCPSDAFQHELNREECQSGDPDNPNPRQYADMTFVENKIVLNMARKILRNSQKGRY